MKNLNIENSQECFVRLWLRLERTRRLLERQYRRFCLRHVLKVWFGSEATDDVIWQVCRCASLTLNDGCDPIGARDLLPPPSLSPRIHRELLRAIVSVRLGIGVRKVDLKALDRAYSVAFPHSTPLNVNKK